MARVKIGNVFPSDEYLLARCAPAGFGLGKTAAQTSNLNTSMNCGWYSFGAECANRPFDFGIALVLNRYNAEIVQIAFDVAMENGKNNGAITLRVYRNSAWGEWEWVNPPMAAGTEYRTTERYMGKPVYAKLVDCGGCPGVGTKTVAHNTAGVVEWILSAQGQADNGHVFPCKGVDIETSLTDIIIHAENDSMKDTACYVLLKYTKI